MLGSRRPVNLNPKEWRIVRLVTEGLSNKEIALAIGTSENMVKNHLRVIYDETGMGNRLELALWYVAVGESLNPSP